jgi:adenosylcobinamide-GDP ribazoletransferase
MMGDEHQSTISGHVRDWIDDICLGIGLLTRVPMPHPANATIESMARAQRAFPLVGAMIGLMVGLVDRCLLAIGVPSLAAAALALGAGAALTGALHEDGLADVGDGFGGGRDRAAKLSIMRDSRLGTYGMIVLLVGFVARASALASLPLATIIPALIVAHAMGRTVIPVLAASMPFARDDGLGKSAGRPDIASTFTAAIIGVVITLVCLPATQALLAVVVAAAGTAAIAALAWRQIGGVTGDVFGAAEQVVEAAVLVMLATQLS